MDAAGGDDADPSAVEEAAENVKKARRIGLSQVLLSTFGMYLLILILSSVANNGINNQISNILLMFMASTKLLLPASSRWPVC
jgi:hypothetical protein